jgi:hypothetical protein
MLPGCITGAMWSQANDASVYTCKVAGVLAGANGANGAPPQLVVEACVSSSGAPDYFVVPLEADGRPAAPFRYEGEARNLLAIAAEKGHPHGPDADSFAATRVLHATLDRPAERSRVTQSPAYRPLDVEPCADPRHYTAPTWESNNGVLVTALRLGHDGQLTPAPGERTGAAIGADGRRIPSATRPTDTRGQDILWPDDCIFVVLPQRQPRPARDVAASRFGAALMTPITGSFDALAFVATGVVAVPVLVLMLVTGYSGC